jgi:hypothetical protein
MPCGVYQRPSLEERFWKKVEIMPNGCWEWQGMKNQYGYGLVWIIRKGKRISAHIFAHLNTGHTIPDGFDLDHLCRNHACVNPDHLEAVTHQENIRRGDAGKSWGNLQKSKTHCPKGHIYDLFNTYIRPDGTGRGCKICRKEAKLRKK